MFPWSRARRLLAVRSSVASPRSPPAAMLASRVIRRDEWLNGLSRFTQRSH